jgi:hypothetical protein
VKLLFCLTTLGFGIVLFCFFFLKRRVWVCVCVCVCCDSILRDKGSESSSSRFAKLLATSPVLCVLHYLNCVESGPNEAPSSPSTPQTHPPTSLPSLPILGPARRTAGSHGASLLRRHYQDVRAQEDYAVRRGANGVGTEVESKAVHWSGVFAVHPPWPWQSHGWHH